MDSKAEAKAAEWAERHAAEFRKKHGVSQEEWDLADAMAADLCAKLLSEFWEVYDRESERDVRRPGKPSLPGDGMANEMRSKD